MDLISREALKELLQHNRNSLKGIGGDEYALKAFDYCIKRIDEQPTIEAVPVVHGWIPCSERLPEPFVYVLIVTDAGTFDVACTGYSYSNINDVWRPVGGGYRKQESVVAWMPLPEPYVEQT